MEKQQQQTSVKINKEDELWIKHFIGLLRNERRDLKQDFPVQEVFDNILVHLAHKYQQFHKLYEDILKACKITDETNSSAIICKMPPHVSKILYD